MSVQTLLIRDWYPAWNPNGNNSLAHWSTRKKIKEADEIMAWTSAQQEGWQKVTGRARLTITFIYRRTTWPDQDNLAARCKGLIDGLKLKGFIVDDSSKWLELHVGFEVQPGVKATKLCLEAL